MREYRYIKRNNAAISRVIHRTAHKSNNHPSTLWTTAVGVVEQHKHGKQTVTIDNISERDGGSHTTISCVENGFDSFVNWKNQHNHII